MKKKSNQSVRIQVAHHEHVKYVSQVCSLIESAAQVRGTGIAKRSPEYLEKKIQDGKAVIALSGESLAGFCYIETWQHGRYTANSGLIVHPDFQGQGLGRKIKETAFQLSRKRYPDARIFGITTSLAVMKINSALGYEPVTFSELTSDDQFWQGCTGCVNYDILNRTGRKHCLCTGMLFDPAKIKKNRIKNGARERWKRFREFVRKYRSGYNKNGYAKQTTANPDPVEISDNKKIEN